MNMPYGFERILILTASIYLAACAPNITKSDAQPPSEAQPKISVPATAAKKLVLQVTGNQEMTSSSDWPSLVEEWQNAMSVETSNAGMDFSLLIDGAAAPSAACTLVKVTVTDFRYMSQMKRFALGVMAGNAYMDLNVEFFEMPAHKTLGQQKYNTSTSGGQGIFSAATPKQVQAVAADIVKSIKGN